MEKPADVVAEPTDTERVLLPPVSYDCFVSRRKTGEDQRAEEALNGIEAAVLFQQILQLEHSAIGRHPGWHSFLDLSHFLL